MTESYNVVFEKTEKAKAMALTGYGCTGSWMYAVHRSSRSVGLARSHRSLSEAPGGVECPLHFR